MTTDVFAFWVVAQNVYDPRAPSNLISGIVNCKMVSTTGRTGQYTASLGYRSIAPLDRCQTRVPMVFSLEGTTWPDRPYHYCNNRVVPDGYVGEAIADRKVFSTY
eukprot:scaffold10500_cov48-Attheya_sp.AAC.2